MATVCLRRSEQGRNSLEALLNPWKRYVIEDRFEHQDGVKLIDLGECLPGTVSHGYVDASTYISGRFLPRPRCELETTHPSLPNVGGSRPKA